MEKFSVKKPFTVLVGVVLVLVLGIVSLTSMAMDLLPTISMPMLIVITTYPGASAEKVEADVTAILESNLGTITGVTDVASTSSENYCMVQLTFEDGTDMDSALVKVSSAVQTVSAYLPDDCGVPSIMEISMDMMATMYLSVAYEGEDIYALSNFVTDTVTPTLERVDGVASVSEVGLVEKTIYVELNQDKIDAVNADILAQVDEGLADAKEALDEADAEVADAIAELEEAQATFGEVLGDEIFAMLEDPMYDGIADIRTQLADLSIALEDARIDTDSITGSVESAQQMTEVMAQYLANFYVLSEEEVYSIYACLTVGSAEELAVLLSPDPDNPLGTDAYLIQTNLTDAQKTVFAQLFGIDEAYINYLDIETLYTLISVLQMAFAIEDTTVGGLVTGGALSAVDVDEIEDALDDFNDTITEVQNSLWSIHGQMDDLPGTVNDLIGIYAGMTQIQLEAAVGFSTATVALSTAEAELEAARTQYEAAEESALASANLDALLDVSTLAQLIYAQNFSMPAGYIDDADDNSWLLKVGNAYESTDALSDALLLTMDGVGDITIADVADVIVFDNADQSYARLNGEYAVILAIYKSSTAGTNDVSSGVIEAYDSLVGKYQGLTFVTLMNQGDYIDLIVDGVVSSMAIGAFLAVLILAIFLKDILPTLVVGVSIPLSVLFAIVLMYFTGLSLNMMTLCGLALGIGMLVDNSIVVIENIYRLRGRGVSAPRAAVQATRQVSGAIIASTLTTISVFLPFIFTTGTVRELLMPMGLSIAYCLLASLAVALTVVPATASTLLRNTKPKDHPWFDKIQAVYGKSLDFCLRVKAVPIGISLALLALCVWQIFQMGIVVIPSMSSDEIEVSFTTEAELTREESYAQAAEVMDAMLSVENVTNVGVMGASDAMSLMGVSMGGGAYGSYTYYITASENAGSGEIAQICTDIEAAVAALGYEASADSGGMSDLSAMTTSGLSITIEGDDLDTLAQVGEQVAALVEQVEGYTDVYNGVGEGEATLQLDIDKDKAMEYGFTVVQIYMQIASYLTDEATSTTLTVDGENMQVIVQDLTSPLTVENLMEMEFEATSYTSSDSSMDFSALSGEDDDEETEEDEEEDDGIYLLSEFATVTETTTIASINRSNQSRYISVTASTLSDYNATLLAREVTEMIEQAQADGLFPDGYTITVGGESDEVMEMVEQMLLMVLLALIFIYLVMVAQFQSLLSPFIVLFTIPLAFTGGLIGLLVSGEQLSIISIMGFLVLMGTVVNNGIVFVDYANQLRMGGMQRRAALIATGQTRMRPIFMTAITTILAMMQLIIGDDMASQMSSGMAIVITGGLLYATLMTLYVIPVMYDILFKRQPMDVDIGSEDLDDVPDDAAEFIAAAIAKENRLAEQEEFGEAPIQL